MTIAQLKGQVLGFVALRPDLARLDQIFVASTCLGKGAGKALFAHARQVMPNGFSLWTHGANIRAQRFYEVLSPLRWEDGQHPKHGHPIRTYWF